MQDRSPTSGAPGLPPDLSVFFVAVRAAANAIAITDPQGTIEWVNSAFCALTGYSEDEAVGANPRDLVKSGEHDLAFYRNMWETIRSGHVWGGEMTNRRKDGSRYIEEQTITPVLGDAGQITHFVAIKQDVTARRNIEAQYLEAQKMECFGRLAGGVAHDFNNLLTVINGTTELVLQQMAPDHPLLDELSEIRRAGERGAALTRQLLAFSRRQPLVRRAMLLSELVHEMAGMLERLLGEDLHLRVIMPEDLRPVLADPSQITQVVLNLVVNARDAMPDGGTLTIAATNVPAGGVPNIAGMTVRDAPYVMLSVGDTGTGMDAATCARIFEPFFTTKPHGKGTGLGLSTVYGIVLQGGGGITVESELGVGTTFEVYLPEARGPTEATKVHVAGGIDGGKETILLVEDDPSICRVAERILRKYGYSVIVAMSGEAAISTLEREASHVDLVLSDVVMPDMSGPELIAQLNLSQPRIRTILASGFAEDALERHGIDPNKVAFISKPYSVQELARKVREVLDA